MSSEVSPLIAYRVTGAVATLTITHPTRLNAMTFEMWESLSALLEQAANDSSVHVLVLRGDGNKAFSSGADISQFGARRSTEEGVALWKRTVMQGVDRLARFPKPVIAVIEGICYGGGLGLALHCDLRFVVQSAAFSIPAAKLGVGYYPSWLKRLTALTGPAVAKEIMFTARRYDAEQALRIGLINGIDTEAAIQETVERIAGLAPLSLIASKLAIEEAVTPGLYGVAQCEQALAACFASQDYKEGQAAFKEKRTPSFSGR